MGPGAFGHITTAMVCAASSFDMRLTDPRPFLDSEDVEFFKNYQGDLNKAHDPVPYVQPGTRSQSAQGKPSRNLDSRSVSKVYGMESVHSKIVTLGDFIDTDALSPGDTLTSCVTDEDFGRHVLEYTHPDFRDKVKGGQQVVVCGRAMGVGSSRETAVRALKGKHCQWVSLDRSLTKNAGVGVKAVIGRSFAFIYSRNQPSLGLPGIVMEDEDFYEMAKEGAYISVDLDARSIEVGGRKFEFQLSDIEYNLIANKGVAATFRTYGKDLWKKMTDHNPSESSLDQLEAEPKLDKRMDW